MADKRSVADNLRAVAVEAARASGVAQEASAFSLFSKFSAIEACRANPFQPYLVWHPCGLGSMMQLDLRERVSQDIFMFGAFEPDLLWFLTCVVEPGQVFFDCGAHIGFFSIAAGQLVGPEGRVDAFEPVAATKTHLDTNVRNGGHGNTKTHLLALWSAPATIQIYDYGPAYSAFNSIRSPRLAPGDEPPLRKALRVPATSLDAFVEAAGYKPNVVKIDVESAEDKVVSGMARTLAEARPIVVIEVGDFPHADGEETPTTSETLQRLEDAGYKFFDLHSCRLTPHQIDASRRYDYGNIAAIPSERVLPMLERFGAIA